MTLCARAHDFKLGFKIFRIFVSGMGPIPCEYVYVFAEKKNYNFTAKYTIRLLVKINCSIVYGSVINIDNIRSVIFKIRFNHKVY
jgi:hypothetical protein